MTAAGTHAARGKTGLKRLRRQRRDARLAARAAPYAETIGRALDEASASHGGVWPVRVHAMVADALGLPHSVVYAYLATLWERRVREHD
ncbi:MAG TPA: hypothetical protein VFP65_08890 [Anaeromyxobacteraceae bacterium]|nr:hypothetical protein [Anaeromyxobacteraceae bacterium]